MEFLRSLREVIAAADDDDKSSDDEVSRGVSAETFKTNDGGTTGTTCSNNPLDAYDLWHPKPRDDCAICMRPLPIEEDQTVYNGCCGKMMCGGCMQAARLVLFKTNQKRKDEGKSKLPDLCPYCREPTPIGEAAMWSLWEKRKELGDAVAYYQMGLAFLNGTTGRPRRVKKAFDLLVRSADMGFPEACLRVAAVYDLGHGGIVPKDSMVAKEYYQLAAKGGNLFARNQLAHIEINTALNIHLAIKHLKIAAENGYKISFDKLMSMKEIGLISKEECNETARAYYDSVAEMRSENRENFPAMRMRDLQDILDGLDAVETKGKAEQAKNVAKTNNKKKGGKSGKSGKKGGKKKNRK